MRAQRRCAAATLACVAAVEGCGRDWAQFSLEAGEGGVGAHPELTGGGGNGGALAGEGGTRHAEAGGDTGGNGGSQGGAFGGGAASEGGSGPGRTPIAVASGALHSCAIARDNAGGSNQVFCWGSNQDGQLGDGTRASQSDPIKVPAASGATMIAAGASHTCALLSNGTVGCWGRADDFAIVGGLFGVTAITAGGGHTCAIRDDGKAYCWGSNAYGQCGVNSDAHDVNTPTQVIGLSEVVEIRASYAATCARVADGSVSCWGWNNNGELSIGSHENSKVPKPVLGLGKAKAIAPAEEFVGAGSGHTCALLTDDTVWCWGYVELGAHELVEPPAKIEGLSEPVALWTGGRRSCAKSEDGSVSCWGGKIGGSWGYSGEDYSAPYEVPELAGVSDLAFGAYHACGLFGDAGIKCVGLGFYGQTGAGDDVQHASPIQAFASSGSLVAISGGSRHTCVLTDDARVECAGADDQDQTGILSGEPPLLSSIPNEISLLSGTNALSVGGDFACALGADSSVNCWGDNHLNQLGPAAPGGLPFSSSIPSPVSLTPTASSIHLGYHHACAVLSDSSLWCWGSDFYSALSKNPMAMPGIADAVQVAAGSGMTCALLAGGAVQCWGNNDDYQLGDGTQTAKSAPGSAPLSGAKSVEAGGYHACAVMNDKTVACWGGNERGQLGLGSTATVKSPQSVSGLANVASLAAGIWHTCALLEDKTVTCWGNNSYGQLGDGTFADHQAPTPIAGLTGVTAITAGEYHTCALLEDKTARCWGYSGWGQFGDGGTYITSELTTVDFP